MLGLRGARKQLPDGVRALLYKDLKVGATEVTARMVLARKYPAEDQLVAIATTFKSWDAIRRRALPTKAGLKMRPTCAASLERIYCMLEEMDGAEFGEEEHARLADIEVVINRYRETPVALGGGSQRTQRRAGAGTCAGDLAQLLREAGRPPEVVDEQARRTLEEFARSSRVDLRDPPLPIVRQFTVLFEKNICDADADLGIENPYWKAAATQAVRELMASGVRP